MILYSIAITFNHSFLIEGSFYLFCNSSLAGSSFTANNIIPSSQYISTAGTVAALHQTVDYGNAARGKAIAIACISNFALGPQFPNVYKFAIRVAHVSYAGNPPIIK